MDNEYKVYCFDDECWIASRISYEATFKFYLDMYFDLDVEDIEVVECDLNEKLYCSGEDRYYTLEQTINEVKLNSEVENEDIFVIGWNE